MAEDYQQALIAGYTAQTAALQAEVAEYLTALYEQSPNYRDPAAAEFAAQAAPVMIGSQESMSILTEAYLALLIEDMTGESAAGAIGLVSEALDFDTGLRGVPPLEVYRRPFETVWTALSQGKPFDQAVSDGADRLASIASTDLQLAKTHTARDVFADESIAGVVVGYRRVLEGAESCGLCILASTQRYHKADLMPIHSACDCSVAPLIGDQDPGQTINDQAVVDVHAAIRERFGDSAPSGQGPIDYRRVLISHEHGEIGPVLTRRADEWTGPSDLAG